MLAQLGEQHLQMEKKRVRDCGLVALWFECKTAAALRHDVGYELVFIFLCFLVVFLIKSGQSFVPHKNVEL